VIDTVNAHGALGGDPAASDVSAGPGIAASPGGRRTAAITIER
jgi:hypothetical protein